MDRRQALGLGAAALSAFTLGETFSSGAEEGKKTSLGLVSYCLSLRQRARQQSNPKDNLFEPLAFLEYCRGLGAGGIQLALGIRDEEYTKTLRRRVEQYGMFMEGIIAVPADKTGLERFEREVVTAARAGVLAVRTVIIPGRRYEYFDSAERFRTFVERGRRSLELAEPVAARHRLRLAVENHKDERIPQRLELFKRLSSEWIGACLDTGNSIALLEDPLAVVEAYAPWTFAVHLKDQAVREYDDGFLLADIPLGQGFLDLKRMVALVRKAKPDMRFCLELITRDPLRVPCLTEKYWLTMADVPAADLARTLRTVRRHRAEVLPTISTLSPAEQVAREEANVKASLAYARGLLE